MYRLGGDLQAAGVRVRDIALLVRAGRRATTAAEELEPLTLLFQGCDEPGGAALAQVRTQVFGLKSAPMSAQGCYWSLVFSLRFYSCSHRRRSWAPVRGVHHNAVWERRLLHPVGGIILDDRPYAGG